MGRALMLNYATNYPANGGMTRHMARQIPSGDAFRCDQISDDRLIRIWSLVCDPVRWALVSKLLSELGCCSLPVAFPRLWTHSNTVYCDTCSYNIGSAVVSESMSYSVDVHRQWVGVWSCTGIRAV